MIITDAHTHIYPCFDLDRLVESAFRNFSEVISTAAPGGTAVLFLTDSVQTDSFAQLRKTASATRPDEPDESREWSVFPTDETTSLKLTHMGFPGMRLFLIGGFQVVTLEKIEVLSVGVQDRPSDGSPLDRTIDTILADGGVAILPWGVGKWLGTRKRILTSFINDNASPQLFFGDNGNRPALWPEPGMFSSAQTKTVRVLSGTDPLPLGGEERRVGSFGSIIHAVLDENRPTDSIKDALAIQHTRITPFGQLQPFIRFARQQIRLRLK